jgi:RNA polymerase sigma-70 factor (ECF subfamily)
VIRAQALRGAPAVDIRAEALARAASGGDDEAFAALVARYQRRLLGFAYQHLRDPDEAQDLAQEVFVRLYRGLHRYDTERPFEPWFWRLAANVAVNYSRRRGPERGGVEAFAELAAPVRDDADLTEALAELEPAARLPLLLHYYSGLSLEEVASALSITLPAVKSRMHRARGLLRRALVESGA